MKIKTLRHGDIVDIFAIYNVGDREVFLGLPKNQGGLVTFNSDECEVIDASLNGRYVYFENDGGGVFHWALIEERLLDDVLEHDDDAYKKFVEILKSEGQLEEDFY